MSYKAGQIEVYDPSLCKKKDKWGSCDCKDAWHEEAPHDLARDFPGQKAVFLPHSCDAWIIGGKDEIKAMIADLQEALSEMES